MVAVLLVVLLLGADLACEAHGQLGDHRVHDAASLEAAVAKLWSTQQMPALVLASQRVVLLREGEYELRRTLVLPNNTALRAEPGHEVALRLVDTSMSHPVLRVRDASSVTVSGIRVVGHASSSAGELPQRSTALEVEGGADVTLERLTVSGGLKMSGGVRHTLTRSVVSNEFGAAHGNCVYLTNAGDGMDLTPCGHTISHTEIHDCRGLGDPWPSSQVPCDPVKQKKQHKPPCPPDPFPNITGNGILINQVVGAIVTNNYIHNVNYHGIYSQSRIHSRFPDPTETPSANNLISLNHVEDYGQCNEDPVCNMTGASGQNGQPGADPGCIYFFDGPLCCYGTNVTYNFCHMNKKGMKGLYLDGFTSGITTRGNIMWNISGNVIDNNDGHDNHHFGNIAINGRSMGALTDSNFWNCDDAKQHDGCGPHNLSKLVGHTCTPHFWEHYDNYGTFNQTKWISTYFESDVWMKHFPTIQTWWKKTTWDAAAGGGRGPPVSCDQKGQFTDCCMFPTGTKANYSVMVNTPWDAGRQHVQCAHNDSQYCTWQNISLAGWCANSHAFDAPVGCWPIAAGFQQVGPQKLYTVDPGFVDMARGNFALKPDAQLFDDLPGFPSIPFAEIGPRYQVGHVQLTSYS